MPWPEVDPAVPQWLVMDFIGEHYLIAVGVVCVTLITLPLWHPDHPRAIAAKKHIIYATKLTIGLLLFILLAVTEFYSTDNPMGFFAGLLACIASMPFIWPFIVIISVMAGQMLFKEKKS